MQSGNIAGSSDTKKKPSCNYRYVRKDGKRIPEHRFLMETYLGSKIPSNLVVHHRNGCKQDNRIENLMVLTHKIHRKIHGKTKVPPKCPVCGLIPFYLGWGYIRVAPRLERKLKEICKRTRRTYTTELTLMLEKYKPKH